MRNTYSVEIWMDGLLVEANDPGEAIKKAKAMVLCEGLDISVELCGDEDTPKEDFDEADRVVTWDVGRELLGSVNSLN